MLPPQRIADIAAEIAEGLAFAHRNGVVHRDVKPANVMVLASGAVKITDFGIALLPTGTRTMAGNVFGSPRYTSPEQVMGRPVDGRSDIFSLGAVLYEMLTGMPPFAGNDLNGILKAVLSDPTPPPTSHNPKLPRAFDHIVGKALAKDPNDRYQDADEMARDLRQFDTLEFASARAVAPAGARASDHSHRRPVRRPASAGCRRDAAAASADLVTPPSPAWWRRPWVIGASALGVLAVVGLVAALGSRNAPVTKPATPIEIARAGGTIAAAPRAGDDDACVRESRGACPSRCPAARAEQGARRQRRRQRRRPRRPLRQRHPLHPSPWGGSCSP